MINLHQQSLQVVFGQERIPHRRVEAGLLGAHLLGYCLVIFLPLGFVPGLLFIAIHKALTGVFMTSVFAPNHKGMPILEPGQSRDFLHRQVLTSRNVRGNPLIDFWYGGLNYQIEHHLFPMMPRNRLPDAQPIVKSFCAEQGILYHETGMLESYIEIFQSFRDVGRVLR
jgi:fatty acid desaturase